MNILAIDQARNGAWAVADYDTRELIGYGTFSFDFSIGIESYCASNMVRRSAKHKLWLQSRQAPTGGK